MQPRAIGLNAAWVTVPEATALAGVSRQSVYQWIAQGRLTAAPTAQGHCIERSELDRFLAVRRAAAAVGIKVKTLRKWSDGEARI